MEHYTPTEYDDSVTPTLRQRVSSWISGRLFGSLARGPQLGDPYDVAFTGYYVACHTWTSTPGEPQLSVKDAFAAAETIRNVNPPTP